MKRKTGKSPPDEAASKTGGLLALEDAIRLAAEDPFQILAFSLAARKCGVVDVACIGGVGLVAMLERATLAPHTVDWAAVRSFFRSADAWRHLDNRLAGEREGLFSLAPHERTLR